MKNTAGVVDRSALKVNQASIIAFVTLGFILNWPMLPAVVAAIMLAGSFLPKAALFKLAYAHVLKPLGIVTPEPVEDNPAAHEFAQLLGGIVLGIGSAFLFGGYWIAGWSLAWVVILLASANLFFGFCAGCFVYYQLRKRGVKGFEPGSGIAR